MGRFTYNARSHVPLILACALIQPSGTLYHSKRPRIMFFHLSLSHEICLHPKYFGPNLMETVKTKLFNEVEGTCSGKHGFIIAVTTIDNIGHGIIQPAVALSIVELLLCDFTRK
ncbi:hypothetical protein L596_007862 [Steinernema carpocapsae]|uniref:RNA polymerase Rpb7-like N-terminal domain-containing protein n=1 Tax=Steinernema carpocapsae TaxID=34508 RepID=A0A4U5PAV2_STECR|nr:hypothetical protein L596_007862 [Steinernema carpocapsae]